MLDMPWCIGGDFNSVLDSVERIRVSNNKVAIKSFNAFLFDATVVDFPLLGMTFTWLNQREEVA